MKALPRHRLHLATLALGLFWVGAAGAAEPRANPADRAAAPSAPSPPHRTAPEPGHAPAATPRPGVERAQSIRGDDVLIQGKLYSPQALFIVSRTAETFGRDAVVPHTLRIQPGTAFLPYRLRTEAAPDSAAPPKP